jgi:hypothetical protein
MNARAAARRQSPTAAAFAKRSSARNSANGGPVGAPKLRRGQVIAKTCRSGAIACFRVLRARAGRVDVQQLYLAKRYATHSNEPAAGFRLATKRDHEAAQAEAERWNARGDD